MSHRNAHKKKLLLSSQTLRTLSRTELDTANGGTWSWPTFSCINCFNCNNSAGIQGQQRQERQGNGQPKRKQHG